MHGACAALATLTLLAGAPQAPSQERIDQAIERGVAYLLRSQQPTGYWAWRRSGSRSGVTALAAYALLEAGVRGHDPAVLDAVAEFADLTPKLTYDTALALIALVEHDAELHAGRIRRLAESLIGWQHGGFGYPDGADLSNTQYGALGLWAAERAGVDVPRRAWSDLAAAVRGYGTRDGGFSYSGGGSATGSMTAAGVGTLALCIDRVEGPANGPGRTSLRSRLAERIDEGLAWLGRNFGVEGSRPGSWYYYYLYGLERVGAFTGASRIGEHDWYAEGARELLARQHEDGSWSDGTMAEGEVVSTAFALLFLKRATRPETPVTSEAGAARNLGIRDPAAPVQVLAFGDTPLTLWIGSIATATAAPIEWPGEQGLGPRVAKVVYLTDAGTLAEVSGDSRVPRSRLSDPRLAARCSFGANGLHRIRADLHVLVPPGFSDGLEGRERILRSGVFEVAIEKVRPAWERELLADANANLLPAARPRVGASSRRRDDAGGGGGAAHLPQRIVDGRLGSCWVAGADDPRPLIEIELDKPVRADRLLVSHALSRPYRPAYYGRAVEIEVAINGGPPQRLRMPYEETRKAELRLPAAVFVRRIELRVRLAVPGEVVPAIGLGEVELQLSR